MNATGIIVEFNPFHFGHKIHIDETRILTNQKIIAVMSGNFVQRGEPAICDKWRRTKMALLNGVDIVLEIPMPYVISGADYFARGSVGILAATGVVNALSFGSECGDLNAIKKAGQILAEEPDIYKTTLQNGMENGLSFAAAKGIALETAMKTSQIPDGLLTKPNNGLAMEYCKALCLLGNPMEIFTTHRKKGGTSATQIRKSFKAGNILQNAISCACLKILQEAQEKGEIATINDFSEAFKYVIYSAHTNDLNLGEGLENRFRKLAGENKSLTDLLDAVKTKRYTLTRLQRIAFQILLNHSSLDMDFYEKNGGPQYIRVLGFKKESTDLLGEITKKATLPVITHGAKMDEILNSKTAAAKMLSKELEVGDIYRLATGANGGYRSERASAIVII